MVQTKRIIKFQMYQQKQQKHSSSETQTLQDHTKIGLLLKKPFLPPIKTRSSSRSKSHHNLQQFTSPKKIKVPDIYYEQPTVQPKKKQLNTIITERDSINEVQVDPVTNQQGKQQTVMKASLNTKPQESNLVLCEKHTQRQRNQLEGVESRISINRLNHKDSNIRHCCQTQPSEQGSTHNVKTKLKNHPHHNSLPQTMKNSANKILPQKLKPIKTNFYQKPEIFGPVPQKLLPPIDRSQFQRYFISKNQQKAIVEKLSKPKHQVECPKKNCQCFHQSRVNNSVSPQYRNLSSFDLREFDTKKIKINIERLKNMNRKNCPEAEDDSCPEHGLKRKIKQKRSEMKKKNVYELQRYDTEPFNSDNVMRDDEKANDQRYAESECQTHQNVFISSKVKGEEQSFITGLVTPSISKMQNQKQKNKVQQKDDGFGPKKPKKVSINIQTQDILIVNDQKTQNMNSTKTIKPLNVNRSFGDDTENLLDRKKSTLSQSSIKDLQKIGYTFGSRDNSAGKNETHQNVKSSQVHQESGVKEYYAGKTREQIIARCTFERQYWIYYQIQKGLFHDLAKPFDKINLPMKPKINLVSSVFKQDILIKTPVKQDKTTTEKPSLNVSQISSIPNLERLDSFPITIDIKDQKKIELPETNSSIISKSRNSPSPSLVKSHINMFNRSPKSLASSKARKCFRIPKESQYVDFVKNYKPLNPQIKIPTLIQQENCKVIPSVSKFFFGQTIGDSIKHGLGVEVSLNQIFEGQYVDGNRKRGYLKVHDGVYEGTFENNLKHGHGIFRWENGQVFEGEWKMGTKNGFGVWTSPDGSYYEGQWHLNMQHGQGKHVHPTGVYQGEFKNFRKQGQGKQSFPNGDKFIGQYKNGKPNGKGKYECSNGTYYEGEFVDGLKEGKGTWHENANTYYEGSLYKDQKHGQGTEYYKDGSYLEGIFINGFISEGKLYNVNKEVIKTIGTNLE